MLVLWASLFAANAHAATAVANLAVSATVTSNCAISTSPLAFGAYSYTGANLATPLTATGSVSVTCTSGATAEVTLGVGANNNAGSPAIPLRRMLSGTTNYLSYFLYKNAIHTEVWADTTATSAAVTANGVAHVITVYGEIPAAQNVQAGSYGDTVIATVTF